MLIDLVKVHFVVLEEGFQVLLPIPDEPGDFIQNHMDLSVFLFHFDFLRALLVHDLLQVLGLDLVHRYPRLLVGLHHHAQHLLDLASVALLDFLLEVLGHLGLRELLVSEDLELERRPQGGEFEHGDSEAVHVGRLGLDLVLLAELVVLVVQSVDGVLRGVREGVV